MGLQSLVRSKGFKNFMAKLYGWGAALVIIGALFKINHYPGAGLMLVIGLGTEAVIFFFSAFEPPHVEPDWSLVYPELAGMYSDSPELNINFSGSGSVTGELDNMLADAKIGPELIESLGIGLRSLSENASKLGDISTAVVATNEFTANVKKASASAGSLTESYDKTASALESDVKVNEAFSHSVKSAAQSANLLTDAYKMTAETLKSDLGASQEYVDGIREATKAAKSMAQRYTESSESLAKQAESIDFSGIDSTAYGEQLQKIAKNLQALNSVYELQLQASSEQASSTAEMQTNMKQFLTYLNESIENTAKYKDEAATLAKNVAALNSVYGRMLSAMNVNVTN